MFFDKATEISHLVFWIVSEMDVCLCAILVFSFLHLISPFHSAAGFDVVTTNNGGMFSEASSDFAR